MKVICLSGTLFTQSADEIKCIMQIFNEEDTQNASNGECAIKLGNHTISYTKQDKSNIPSSEQIGEPLVAGFNVIRCPMNKEQYERYNDPAWAQEDAVLKTSQ